MDLTKYEFKESLINLGHMIDGGELRVYLNKNIVTINQWLISLIYLSYMIDGGDLRLYLNKIAILHQ